MSNAELHKRFPVAPVAQEGSRSPYARGEAQASFHHLELRGSVQRKDVLLHPSRHPRVGVGILLPLGGKKLTGLCGFPAAAELAGSGDRLSVYRDGGGLRDAAIIARFRAQNRMGRV